MQNKVQGTPKSETAAPDGMLSASIDAYSYALDLADSLRGRVVYDAKMERCFKQLRGHLDTLWKLNERASKKGGEEAVLDGVLKLYTDTARDLTPFYTQPVPVQIVAMTPAMLPLGDTFARAPQVEFSADDIARILEWLLREMRRLLDSLPPHQRQQLNQLLEYLRHLLEHLRTLAGRTIPFGVLAEWLNVIRYYLSRIPGGGTFNRDLLIRILQMLRGGGVLVSGGGAGAGAAGTAGGLLTGAALAKMFLAAGLGVLIGWLILEIPVGDGKKVRDVIRDSWLSDGFYGAYMKLSGRFSCEDFYRLWQRSRRHRRYIQDEVGKTAHILPLLYQEIHFLQNYLKCHKPVSSIYQNELKRLLTLKQEVENNPF